ncbi:MAG: HD domain-containing protein [Veillonellaceae bacterium]|jgi:putative nucleotidyltransferase with HDIG domain|nr:HD domain-containing protein [Veillonellaceae bacterium]
MFINKKSQGDILGYVTHDITDKFGRLLLAEGTPLTTNLILKLRNRNICFRMAADPLGTAQSSEENLNDSPFELPKKLDEKLERLDIESVESASKYLNYVLREMQNDFSLSNIIKAFSQGQRATYAHSINVAIISVAIAEKMQFSNKALQEIAIGALLHDVGKMLFPPSVLAATSTINDSQDIIYQQHTRIGADVLVSDKLPPGIYLIAQQHHERYVGGGYPNGIKENEIHINSCIVSVANVFDRLTCAIFQRNPLSPDEAIERILLDKGISFHPSVVEFFEELFKKETDFGECDVNYC